MASIDIPSYLQPCLAATKDSSTVYLVGTPTSPGSALDVNIVSIGDINAPVVKKRFSAFKSSIWPPHIPKVCSSYVGNILAEEYSLHIQQVGLNSSWDTIFYAANETFRATRGFGGRSFSKQSFSYIGQAGPMAWVLAVSYNTDNVIPYSSWTNMFLNLSTGIVSLIPTFGDFTTTDPLLTVGTYTVSPAPPGPGSLIVFDKAGTAMIFPTLSVATIPTTNTWTTLLAPQSVNMNGIKLTAAALYANMGSGVYILDRADNGSVLTYYIDPTISNDLKRISTPNGNTPQFTSIMAATSAGSQVVLYSTNNTGSAKFHIFNTVSNLWSGPEIPITDTGSNPSQRPTEVRGSSSSSSSNLGAIIGGVVGGIALLAAVAFFVIRHRRRQNNSNSNGNNSNSGNSSNGNTASHTNTDYNDKDVRPTEKDARSPEGMPLPGEHPQFPAGAPPVNNYAYGYNYGHEGELGMPLAGSQVISSDPRYNNSAIYPTHTPPNISQRSQESSRRPLQVFVDGNKAEINSSTTSDIVTAAPHSFGDKAELDSSSDVIVTPVRLYTPSPQVSSPHLAPARPPTCTYYSIAQDHAS